MRQSYINCVLVILCLSLFALESVPAASPFQNLQFAPFVTCFYAWRCGRVTNINSHSKFEGIDELMCNSFKIKSLLHKLPLNRATGKDGILAEHISYADSSVCNHLSSLFNVCLMHGKIPQECMQTVIVPICRNENGNISDAGNYREPWEP